MRYFQRVTFQAPTEVRSASGGVSYTYENVLTDVPARIVVARDELATDRLTIITDRFNILVSGDRPEIQPEMAVLDGEAVYDVKRVIPSALGRRARKQTIVEAERVAI